MPGSISPRTGLMRNANSIWLNGQPFQRGPGARARPAGAPGQRRQLLGPVRGRRRRGARAPSVVFAAILGTGCGGGRGGRRPGCSTGATASPASGATPPCPGRGRTSCRRPPCWCGRPGCLETYDLRHRPSARDYARADRRSAGRRRRSSHAARAGDAAAAAALDRYVDRLARGLAVIGDILDPDVIVLGGGMSNVDELYDAPAAGDRRRTSSPTSSTTPIAHGRARRLAPACAARPGSGRWTGMSSALPRLLLARARQPAAPLPGLRLAAAGRRTPSWRRLTIAHLDCDAFYASVEKRDRPELRDQPVIVGGGKRGVVTTCCYIARIYGVRSAMPMFKALKLCPEAVVIKPDFAKYRAESRRIMAKLRDADAAGAAAVAGRGLARPVRHRAAARRPAGADAGPAAGARSSAEIGITVSIGLAANKFLAKIASDLDKPRGFSVIGAAEAQASWRPSPVAHPARRRPGLRQVAGDAPASAPSATSPAPTPSALAERFGRLRPAPARAGAGPDAPRGRSRTRSARAISAETTFNDDLTGVADLEDRLWPLCEKVARQRPRATASPAAW